MTKPRSNQSELPGTIVTASEIQPPVQDSAVASINLRFLSAMPTFSASRYSATDFAGFFPFPFSLFTLRSQSSSLVAIASTISV